MIGRIFPYPLLALSLTVFWLILVESVAPRSLIFAVFLGVSIPHLLRFLDPEPPRISNIPAIIKLFFIVLNDIIRSNLAVMALVLGRKKKERRSGFVRFRLDMKNRYGLIVLGVIITSTPGTIWVQYDSARGILLLHILDLIDEEGWEHLIKNRYEKLLMEIFE